MAEIRVPTLNLLQLSLEDDIQCAACSGVVRDGLHFIHSARAIDISLCRHCCDLMAAVLVNYDQRKSGQR